MKIQIHTGETHKAIDTLEWPENITWVADYPENNMTEPELVEYAIYTLDSISPMYNCLFKTTSSILFSAIRVAVKEGYIEAEDVTIVFVNKAGEIHTPVVDRNGKLDYWPDGMFDAMGHLLDRLLS